MLLAETEHLECGSPPHDPVQYSIALVVAVGLLLSYLPQHYRIITHKTGEGFSPWYLLLGSTSSISSLLNVVTLQWGVVRCCQEWSSGACFENVLGIIQIFIQATCFNLILVFFLVYFPPHRKYVHLIAIEEADTTAEPVAGTYNPLQRPESKSLLAKLRSAFWPSLSADAQISRRVPRKSGSRRSSASSASSDFDPRSVLLPSLTRNSAISLSPEYRLSLAIAYVVLLHTVLSAFITLLLLFGLPKISDTPDEHTKPHPPHSVWVVQYWATFLGLESTVLACFQYLPQLWTTYQSRLVGSLSIPMMLIQAPGSFLFVYQFIGRPGVNYSTWLTYLVTGVLQMILLVMCCAWKMRQRTCGIDDYGKSVLPRSEETEQSERTTLLGGQGTSRRVTQ